MQPDYIQKLREQLHKKALHNGYRQNIHGIHLYTDPQTNDCYISYQKSGFTIDEMNIAIPQWFIIRGIADDTGKIRYLVNNQAINAERWAGDIYIMSFNFTQDNTLDLNQVDKLRQVLEDRYHTNLQHNGSLVTKIKHSFVDGLFSIIKAVKYCYNEGYDYTKQRIEADTELNKQAEQVKATETKKGSKPKKARKHKSTKAKSKRKKKAHKAKQKSAKKPAHKTKKNHRHSKHTVNTKKSSHTKPKKKAKVKKPNHKKAKKPTHVIKRGKNNKKRRKSTVRKTKKATRKGKKGSKVQKELVTLINKSQNPFIDGDSKKELEIKIAKIQHHLDNEPKGKVPVPKYKIQAKKRSERKQKRSQKKQKGDK